MKHAIVLLLLSACSLTGDDIPTWADYEYRTGPNQYIAFSSAHVYRAWYIRGEWREGVTPNVRCSGTYDLRGNTLTLCWYEGGPQVMDIYDLGGGRYRMEGTEVQIWQRTKINTYLR